jgi:hypothetical protein
MKIIERGVKACGGGSGFRLSLFPQQKQRETAGALLLFSFPNLRQPRFSAKMRRRPL